MSPTKSDSRPKRTAARETMPPTKVSKDGVKKSKAPAKVHNKPSSTSTSSKSKAKSKPTEPQTITVIIDGVGKRIKMAQKEHAGPRPRLNNGKLLHIFHWDRALNNSHSRVYNSVNGNLKKVEKAWEDGRIRAGAIAGLTTGSDVGREDKEEKDGSVTQFKFLDAGYVDVDKDPKKWEKFVYVPEEDLVTKAIAEAVVEDAAAMDVDSEAVVKEEETVVEEAAKDIPEVATESEIV